MRCLLGGFGLVTCRFGLENAPIVVAVHLFMELGLETIQRTAGLTRQAADAPRYFGQAMRADRQEQNQSQQQQFAEAHTAHESPLLLGGWITLILRARISLVLRLAVTGVVIVIVAHALSKLANGTAKVTADVANTLGAEDEQNDDKYDQELNPTNVSDSHALDLYARPSRPVSY